MRTPDWCVDAEEVAAAFGVGQALGPLVAAARGWGGHNVIYRLQSTEGSWAIKALARELDEFTAEHFDIEVAAFNCGIPMPHPVPGPYGGCCTRVGGQLLRCHEWIEGPAKTNEETAVTESSQMGTIMGRLHRLRLSWSARFDNQLGAEGPSWPELAEAGTSRGAVWAETVNGNLVALEAISAAARKWRSQERPRVRIGSHRDLNAHNVLFGPSGLSLVDWDAAGPIDPRWELANYATLWSARVDGSYDPEAILSFLVGYQEGGGHITGEEPDTLGGLIDNVESWTKNNVRWAVTVPSEGQDENAQRLIRAPLSTPAAVDQRRHLLSEAVVRLGSAT